MNPKIINENIKKSFDESKNSHAFLCETNNVLNAYNDILDIVRYINCKNKKDDCDCNICKTIKNNTNPDILVINNDNKEIKKEDISGLITQFKTTPLINKYSVYIILHADKLNVSASNTILKFLEEPENNIIGFFITSNQNALLPTIKSRLSLLNYKYETNNLLDALNITEEEFNNYYQDALKLLILLNNEKHYMMMKESKNISKKERNEIESILNIVKEMYTIKFRYLSDKNYKKADFIEEILKNIETNDINIIVKRIKLLDNIISDIGFNVNKDLIINKLFISWE